MKTSSVEQFVGKGLVGLVILLGYIMEVLIGWSAAFRRNVWDWRLEQWQLQRRDLPELLCGRHALLHSSDTALYELMPAGAQHHSLHFRMHDGVFFVSLPCQITDLDGRHALASAQCSPHMVATAAIIDFLGEDETRHSDGLISTSLQRHPPYQPHVHLPEITRSISHEALAACLRPAIWCYADPSRVEHGRAILEGSPALQCAIDIVMPAICKASKQHCCFAMSAIDEFGVKTEKWH